MKRTQDAVREASFWLHGAMATPIKRQRAEARQRVREREREREQGGSEWMRVNAGELPI